MAKNRSVKLLKIAAIVVVTVAIYFPWRASANQDSGQAPQRLQVAGYGASMDERLGKDDGAAFVIHFMGDTHGSLETCGCKGKLSGGLARRIGFLDAFAKRFNDVPHLLVDSGGFLSDKRVAHDMLIGYAMTQDEWMLKAYDRFRVDVANVSDHDMPFVSSIASGEEGENGGPFPIMDRLVSANASPASRIKTPVKPYIIREVQARMPGSGGRKPARIAFIGVTDTLLGETTPVAGVHLLDPFEAVRRAVAEVRDKSDVVIVLAHLDRAKAIRIAKETAGVDLLIAGNDQPFTAPEHVGKTDVAFTPFETTMLGEARFYPSENGRFSVKERYIGIDTGIPEDKDASDLAATAKKLINAQYKPLIKSQDEAMADSARAAAAAKSAGYVSAGACAKCHSEQYATWVNSGHGHALTSLATMVDKMDNRCLVCHTTGYAKGSPSGQARPLSLINVQCEQCHGPGADHILKPDKSYGHVKEGAGSCVSCHTGETSPKFNLQAYMEKMKH